MSVSLKSPATNATCPVMSSFANLTCPWKTWTGEDQLSHPYKYLNFGHHAAIPGFISSP